MRQVRCLSLAVILFCTQSLTAREYWVPHRIEDPTIPWTALYQVLKHNNEIYVAGRIDTPYFERGLWKSTNGRDWEQLTTPDQIFWLINHNNDLYAWRLIGNPFNFEGTIQFFRFKEDQTWEDLGSIPHNSFMNPQDMLSFDGHIYATFMGAILKINLNQTPFSGEQLPRPYPNYSQNLINFFIYRGRLHAASVGNVHNAMEFKIVRLREDDTWEDAGFLPPQFVPTIPIHTVPRVEVLGDDIYLSTPGLWKSSGDTFPYEFTEDPKFSDELVTPIPLFGQMHILREDRPFVVLTENNTWEEVSQGIIDFNHRGFGELDDRAFLGTETLWILQHGVQDVVFEIIPLSPLVSGQKDGVVLGFSIQVNIEDIMNLTVRNLGTARLGTDIKSVKLIQSQNLIESGQGSIQTLGVFESNSGDPRTWSLTSPVPVYDGDKIFVAVEVSDQPTDGATIIASIGLNDISFSKNPQFTLPSPLTTGQSIEIKKISLNAISDIAEAVIFPQPAKDQVHFLYDLDSPSNVDIKIYNRQGTLVTELKDNNKSAGNQQRTTWNSSRVASGVYHALVTINPTLGGERKFKKQVYIEK